MSVQNFTETIKGQQVKIEVWPLSGWNTTYTGYAYCPMKECDSKDAFTAANRSTPGRAKSDAKKSVTNHLTKVHKL